MKKIITFLVILIVTILLTSCSTQQRVVYKDCDCPTNRYDYWNRYSWGNPYLGWNTLDFNYWNWYSYRVIPRYYVYPNRIQPSEPSRYQRKEIIGPRPSRNSQNNSSHPDNLYPGRTQPSKSKNETPTRWESPSRNQQMTNPNRVESPSRNQQRTNPPTTTQPSRVGSPPRVQQRTNTPITSKPTRSRVQNN